MKNIKHVNRIHYQNQKPTTLTSATLSISLFRCNLGPLAFSTSDGSATVIARDQSNTVINTSTAERRQSHTYSPYGYSPSVDNCPLGYNGELIDHTLGAYPLGKGFRFYLQDLGRFNSPDTVPPFSSLNAYAYCGNDPINAIDPSGHIMEMVYKQTPRDIFTITTTTIVEHRTPSLWTAPKTHSLAYRALKYADDISKLITQKKDQKALMASEQSTIKGYQSDLDYARGDSRGWKHENKIQWNIKYHTKNLRKITALAQPIIDQVNTEIPNALQNLNATVRALGLTPFEQGTSFKTYKDALAAQIRASKPIERTINRKTRTYQLGVA
ncbi:RHS repeat-associated protein [Pseudomonas sp. Y3 TE3536]